MRPKGLAMRTKVGAALPNGDALDGSLAAITGFPSPLVDLEFVLEFAAAVDPVDAGPITADALLQDFPDRFPQRLCLFPFNRIGDCQRVQARLVQGFVRIDVAHPG